MIMMTTNMNIRTSVSPPHRSPLRRSTRKKSISEKGLNSLALLQQDSKDYQPLLASINLSSTPALPVTTSRSKLSTASTIYRRQDNNAVNVTSRRSVDRTDVKLSGKTTVRFSDVAHQAVVQSDFKFATDPMDNPLIVASLSKPTQKKYRDAINHFRTWLADQKMPDLTILTMSGARLSELDIAMSNYFSWSYLRGGKPWIGNQLVSGVAALVAGAAGPIKVNFPVSKRAIRGWERLCPTNQRPPMPLPIAAAVALTMMHYGRPRWGAAVMVIFDALLRIGEAVAMRPEHVRDTSQFGPNAIRKLAIRLPKAKGGLNQAADVIMPSTIRLLQFWRDRPASDGTIFGLSDKFYDFWHFIMVRLGLNTIGFTPHCLRHGGATYMAMCGSLAADIQRRGRWKQLKSAQRYEQQAEATFIASNIPTATLRFGHLCLDALWLLAEPSLAGGSL